MMFVLEIDAQLARHLEVALRRHRQALAEAGFPRPAGFADLEAAAARAAIAGQTGTNGDSERDALDEAAYGGRHELVAQKKAAAMLAVSARTIRRMLDRGDLHAVTVNGRRRIARSEIEAFTRERAPRPAGASLGRPGRGGALRTRPRLNQGECSS